MIRRRGIAILLIETLLIVGCQPAPLATTPPSSVAAVPTAPAATAAPAPTQLALPSPGADASCASLGLVISPTFVPGAIDATIGNQPARIALATERAVSVTDPNAVWPGGYDYGAGLPDLIPIRGGGDVEVRLELDYDFPFDWPLEITDIQAVLRVPGQGRTPIEARIAEAPDTVLLTIPDRNVDGSLELEVVASDRCLVYTATGKGNVRIVRGARVDACPVDSEGSVPYWAALNEPPVEAAGVPLELSLTEFVFLWTPGAFGSQGNDGLLEFDSAADTAVGAPGGTVSVAAANDDLRLRSMSVQFFRRRAVLNWLDGGDRPSPVFQASAAPLGDGSLDLLLPPSSGRYATSVFIEWESACARGGAVGAIGIDVE